MNPSFKHKKQFGQHFLKDSEIAHNIVTAFTTRLSTKQVLEIGPGLGILTQFLFNQSFALTISEIDTDVPPLLEKQFPGISGQIILGDFLKMNIAEQFPEPVSVIGNFPYNISSQILFKVLENRNQVPLLVGMFQKEVAVRITGGPRNKDYGILSVLTQAFYETEYLFTLQETDFSPPPKVKSGVICLTRRAKDPACNTIWLYKIVKAGFNQRRKTLRNALKPLLSHPGFTHPLLDQRAEQLSVEAFVDLTNAVQQFIES